MQTRSQSGALSRRPPTRRSSSGSLEATPKRARKSKDSLERPSAPSLLGLPWELRLQILRELLVCDEPLKAIIPPRRDLAWEASCRAIERLNRWRAEEEGEEVPEKPAEPPESPPKTTFKLHLAILAVNRQLNSEASFVFYGENSMTFRITTAEEGYLRKSTSLTIYDHRTNKTVNLESIEPAFLRFSHIHLSVVLDKVRFYHRVAWVLRYLVQLWSESPACSGYRNVTIVYEDRLLEDEGSCQTCSRWPSRCRCPEKVIKREEAQEAPAKMLNPLIYLEDVNDISFEAVQTSSSQRLHEINVSSHIPYYSLKVSYPTKLIESVVHGPKKPNLYPLYMPLLYYMSKLPADDCVSDIAARLKFKMLTDRRAPKLSHEEVVYLDIVKDDEDDTNWETMWFNPAGINGRCPPWLVPEMQLVKRAMLRGDEVAFRELRSVLLERVNIVMKEWQTWLFDDGR